MHIIAEKAELAEFLFQMLDESEPFQMVNASFLQRISGICFSLIHGGLHYDTPYLSDIISFFWERQTSLLCGTKLVALAQSIETEGCFDPERVWSTRRLIELMIAALNNKDLQVDRDHETGEFYVISSKEFSTENEVKVRVRLSEAEIETEATGGSGRSSPT